MSRPAVVFVQREVVGFICSLGDICQERLDTLLVHIASHDAESGALNEMSRMTGVGDAERYEVLCQRLLRAMLRAWACDEWHVEG